MSEPTKTQEELAFEALLEGYWNMMVEIYGRDEEGQVLLPQFVGILRDCVPVPRARLEELERIETWVGAAPIPSNKELIDRAELARLRARVEELEAMLTESQERENEDER